MLIWTEGHNPDKKGQTNMATQTVVPTDSRDVVMIDPALLLGDRNTRYGLKKSRIESLKESIIEHGGVMQPVEVEPQGDNFRLVFGHYRLAALIEANKEGHTFEMPCIVIEEMDPVTRLKRQLAENLDRENQTPIDKAVAIKALFDAGISKQEVRKIFATPGGRKGLKTQDASNSFINMTLSFLNFSKKVQQMIHEGEIGVADAYFLSKQTPEKQDIYLEKAIANRLKEISIEEEDENNYLAAEAKKTEAESKVKEMDEKLEAAQAELEEQARITKEKAAEAGKLYLEKMEATTVEAKAAAAEAHKEVDKEAKAAAKELEAKRRDLERQKEKAEKLRQSVEDRAEKLKEARENSARAASEGKKKDGTKKDGKVAPLKVKSSAAADVKNAPNEDGIPITITAIKKLVDSLSLAGSYPKVTLIGRSFRDCFNGRINEKQLLNNLAVITGEKKEATAPAKKAKA
jgi:ParB/RepB/Spo0J family partition protein